DLGFELSPAQLRGNRLLLQELLGNLLDNALRHTPPGGTVTVGCGQNAGGIWVDVEDSGTGIADAERERVFHRFHQAPGSANEGNGLGLAIVSEIARQHGGTVVAGKSERLGGALLCVRFPPSSPAAIA